MPDEKEILFSSFVAGFLLVKNDISFIEISKEMSKFDCSGNFTMIEPKGDFDRLFGIVTFDDFGFHLTLDYNDEFNYGTSSIIVQDYLYDLTTEEVRRYFGIEEREIVNIYTGSKKENNINKNSILMRIKRTKVYS